MQQIQQMQYVQQLQPMQQMAMPHSRHWPQQSMAILQGGSNNAGRLHWRDNVCRVADPAEDHGAIRSSMTSAALTAAVDASGASAGLGAAGRTSDDFGSHADG